MALTKNHRKQVWNKSDGKCWYCGCQLPVKGWHADHFEPLLRDAGRDGDLYPNRDTVENHVPACAPCNIFKSVFSVEEFRQEIELQVERGRKTSVNFRTAERFGLIKAQEINVVFWFEKQGLSVA